MALAKIAAKWPAVREEMTKIVEKWKEHHFSFTLDWLLRCVNAVIHGESVFTHLHETPRDVFENGLRRTEKHVDKILNQISSKLGLDHTRVLFAKYAIPVLVRHIELHKQGKMHGAVEWNLMLYWFLQAGIHGRFSGTTESKIRHDLRLVDGTKNGLEKLIAEIGTTWGRPQILPSDFDSWSIGARTYPVLYWLTRMEGAKDFCYGNELKANMIGSGSELQVHHIFPKAKLYKKKYARAQVNALGNFCFLTAECNQKIGAAAPSMASEFVDERKNSKHIGSGDGYFHWVKEKYPEALESQWIPMDEKLWKIENYPDFLDARRQLLADATNKYLSKLNPKHATMGSVYESPIKEERSEESHSHIASVDEGNELKNLQEWMSSNGLSPGNFAYEMESSSGESNQIIIDLSWPEGLPAGQGEPVALLLNESAETYQAVSQSGYKCFIDTQSFKEYVNAKMLGE